MRQLLTLIAVLCLGTLTCYQAETSEPQAQGNHKQATALITGRTFKVTLPDGRIARSERQLDKLSRRLDFSNIDTLEIDLTADPSRKSRRRKDGEVQSEWQINRRVGNYQVRLSHEYGYVAGCIRKNLRHVGFMINDRRTGREIFNIHLVLFNDGGGPQFGAYNSATHWCYRSRFDYNAVRDGIYHAARNVNVDHWQSAAIAAGTAALALPMLLAL